MRHTFLAIAVACLVSVCAFCEDHSAAQINEGNTVCTFADGEQLSVRYPEIPYDKSELRRGKIWMPANRPIYLFAQTNFKLGSTEISPGAYSLYVIPRDDKWTLVVNRDVEKGSPYDQKKDLVRFDADTGKLSGGSNNLTLYFGRLSPDKCSLRIDYGKERAFADFVQQ